jgi:hypothetical protein
VFEISVIVSAYYLILCSVRSVANERRQIDEELSASDRQLDSIIQERDALRAKIYEISQQMDWKEGMEKSMLDSLQSQVSAWRVCLYFANLFCNDPFH